MTTHRTINSAHETDSVTDGRKGKSIALTYGKYVTHISPALASYLEKEHLLDNLNELTYTVISPTAKFLILTKDDVNKIRQ